MGNRRYLLWKAKPQESGTETNMRGLIAIGVTLVFWASAFAGIRVGLGAYAPGHLALFRFVVASIVLAGYATLTRMRLPRIQDLPAMLFLGFMGVTVYHVFLAYGEVSVTAGAASLLIASGPIFAAVLARLFLNERLTKWGWLGTTVSFLGVFLVALGEGEGMRFDLGAFLILLSAFSASVYFVFQKSYLEKYTAIEFTSYTIWSGTFFMLGFFPGLANEIFVAPADITLVVVYLGAFPAALAYVSWAFALSRAPASIVTSFLFLTPVLAILISWFWLGEIPLALSLIGGATSLFGVSVVYLKGT